MEILVCVKQVPDDSVEVKFNENTGSPDLEKITPIVNAFDGYALEMAARFREAHGGSITVVSVGEEKAKDAVRNCLAVGADKGFVVSDATLNGSDTLATSYILLKAVEKIEEVNDARFDIVFCGQESTDFVSGQVGIQLAEMLGVNQVTNIISVDTVESGIMAKQETEEGYRMVSAKLPALVTVSKPAYEPRYPTMKNKMAARKIEIPIYSAADLGIDSSKVGEAGSFVKVTKVYAPPKKSAGVKVKEESAEESAIKAVGMMVEAKVL